MKSNVIFAASSSSFLLRVVFFFRSVFRSGTRWNGHAKGGKKREHPSARGGINNSGNNNLNSGEEMEKVSSCYCSSVMRMICKRWRRGVAGSRSEN